MSVFPRSHSLNLATTAPLIINSPPHINSLGPADAVLAKLLGAPVRCLTTPCVLAELAALGPAYGATVGAARRAAGVHACGHPPSDPLPAAACLRACIGSANVDHFLVATQDRALRAALAGVPAGAAVFASAAGVHLEPPSAAQTAAVRARGAATLAMPARELAAPAIAELVAEAAAARRARAGPPVRRKGAAGPNPLAAKKRAAKPVAPHLLTKQRRGGQAASGNLHAQARAEAVAG
jgi:U3 small nucleolar RNA-associated protein 23